MYTKIRDLKSSRIDEAIEGNLVVKRVKLRGDQELFVVDAASRELRFEAVYRIVEDHSMDGVALEFVEVRNVEVDVLNTQGDIDRDHMNTVRIENVSTEVSMADPNETKVGFYIADIYIDTMAPEATFMLKKF